MSGLIRKFRDFELIALIGGWLVILVSISRNSWFVFTENAFSDLGGPLARDPWIFNYGLILNGFLIILYGVYLVKVSFNKMSSIGGGSMIITGMVLILIGLYPEGTGLHYFVSIWFFTQADITILTWGLALIDKPDWRKRAILFLLLSTIGPIIAWVIPWPSIAVAEAYGIGIMNIWVILMRGITNFFEKN